MSLGEVKEDSVDYLIYGFLFFLSVVALAWAGKVVGYYVGEGFFQSKREHFIKTVDAYKEGEE